MRLDISSERKSFWSQAFSALAIIWPFFEPTVLRLQVWDAALADLTVEELRYALAHRIAYHADKSPPTPGFVRESLDTVKKMAWQVWEHTAPRRLTKDRPYRAPLHLLSERELPLGLFAHPSTETVPELGEG